MDQYGRGFLAAFTLDAEGSDWVRNTLEALTPRDKIAQLFNVLIYGNTAEEIEALKALAPGSIARLETLSPDEAAAVLETVFVPVNLNEATEEQIRLIPGMTDKMVHEFEEYRPYADMGEFNREIGKYVDEAEVARFRNYVTL